MEVVNEVIALCACLPWIVQATLAISPSRSMTASARLRFSRSRSRAMAGATRGQVNESYGVGGGLRGWLAKNRHVTHPMKEDVKKKRFFPPLGKMRMW